MLQTFGIIVTRVATVMIPRVLHSGQSGTAKMVER